MRVFYEHNNIIYRIMLIRGPSRGTRVETRLSCHSKFSESLEDEGLQLKAFFYNRTTV